MDAAFPDDQSHSTAARNSTRAPSAGPQKECDVVMKGGITSGVVYPKALWVLSEHYGFRNIGGASAGAIAAVIAAAAQYTNERDDEGRLEQLANLATTLTTPKFVERLFQPYKAGRAPYKLLLGFVSEHHRLWWRVLKLLGRMVIQVWPLLLATGVAAWAVWRDYGGAGAIPALVLLAVALIGIAVLWPLWRLHAVLTFENGFGLCPGKTQPRQQGPALLDWMHSEVQRCAGRSADDPPLTFADLKEREIQLQLMTTDLSAGRPVRLPLPDPGSPERNTDYLFRLSELEPLLPPRIRQWLADDSVARDIGGGYRQLPGPLMPIALGARLSLSFPVLLSAVRLHARTANGSIEPRLFSDGGISSNFPIHFFDGWLPRRPTFGLDLIGPDPAATSNVVMATSPYSPLPTRWANIGGLTGFGKQIFDSARNWRDTLQMELPGFRERVCHIRLSKEEGGLNLNMNEATIGALLDRGEEAGYAIISEFSWSRQMWERFRILTALLQENLQLTSAAEAWAPYSSLLSQVDFEDFPYAQGVDAAWRANARDQLRNLLEGAAAWGSASGVSFLEGELPQPLPGMHIIPDV